jgi:hypothetical protein
MEVSGQLHDPAALPAGKLGGPQSRSGRGGEEKNSQPPNPRIPIVQPIAQRYTDWAIMALEQSVSWESNNLSPRLLWYEKVHYPA